MEATLPLLAQSGGALTWASMPDLARLAPGAFLCAWVVVILLVDLVRGRGPSPIFPRLSVLGCAIGLGLVVWSGVSGGPTGYGGFDALDPDGLARIFKIVFLLTGLLTVAFVARSKEAYGNEAELHVLLFGALAGMCYLASATELIGFYLAFETVSYTGFLMAGYRTDSAKSAEAGGKFVVFGAVSSAVMLFGLSLIYGFTGSTQFADIAAKLADAEGTPPALLVAAVFVFAGFAFKAAAFPMQFWCPDVYEGAPAPIAGFLAVASKAAVFAVGLRVLSLRVLGLGALRGEDPGLARLLPADGSITQTILVLAAVGSMTWGNFAALRQKNVQRMLAYSSIAHAGYLLMTAAVAVPSKGLVGDDGRQAIGAIVFYFLIYLLMNLAAFFVVTLLRRDSGSADISGLRGLGAKQPLVAISFAIVLFSLTGLPPTAGFIGKLQLFAPVVNQGFWILAAIGLLNGAVSLYYYANPVREMFLAKVGEGEESRVRAEPADLALVVALAVPLVVLGLFGWDGITQVALDAVARVP